MQRLRRTSYLIVVAFLLPLVAHGQVSVFPSAPRPQEPVRVQVAPLQIRADAVDSEHRVITMSGNKITVELPRPRTTFGVPPSPPTPALDIQLGRFPAGDYQVEVFREVAPATTESIGGASFTVTADNASTNPIQDNTDLWWNPDESGWGLNIIQHGSGIIFATWFNYASDGRATWYVIPTGRWNSPTQFAGPIYQTTGPVLSATFDPSSVTRTLVGNAVLAFSADDSKRMTALLTIGNQTITRVLTRQGF